MGYRSLADCVSDLQSAGRLVVVDVNYAFCGDQPDERWKMHDLRATAFSGLVLICIVIGAFIVEVARGHDGSPYAALGAAAGIAYLVAVIALRVRG